MLLILNKSTGFTRASILAAAIAKMELAKMELAKMERTSHARLTVHTHLVGTEFGQGKRLFCNLSRVLHHLPGVLQG